VNLLMEESPLKRRLAAFGLIAVLLVLTVCSIGATLACPGDLSAE